MTQETAETKTVEQQAKEISPPYIPFPTFNNTFLTWIEGEGIPLKFDRSFWGKKFSGSSGVLLMAGLRFLGLLKEDAPQPKLENIVKTKADERKKLLAMMIRESYTKIDFQQLDRATPSMVNAWMSDYGLDGSTQRKAVSFFINACKAYDIPLSNSLKKMARIRQSHGVKGQKRQESFVEPPGAKGDKTRPPAPLDTAQKGQVYRIKLTSAGEITLIVDLPIFEVSNEDRDFALEMVDKMRNYATNKK